MVTVMAELLISILNSMFIRRQRDTSSKNLEPPYVAMYVLETILCSSFRSPEGEGLINSEYQMSGMVVEKSQPQSDM